jgi:hypothetical protein
MLRAIKDDTGLSLVALARRTHYSKASWQRWLNGERLVTAQAVESLVTAVPCDAGALWAALHAATSGAAARAAGAAAGAGVDAYGPDGTAAPPPTPVPVKRSRWRLERCHFAVAAVVAGILAFSEGLVIIIHGGWGSRPAPRPSPSSSVSAAPLAGCRAAGCYGRDPRRLCADDARTIALDVIEKEAIVAMRYSPSCQAAWAKITYAVPGDRATITSSLGQSEQAVVHTGLDDYSTMVDAAGSISLRVCGTRAGTADACTRTVPDAARAPAVPASGLPDPCASAARHSQSASATPHGTARTPRKEASTGTPRPAPSPSRSCSAPTPTPTPTTAPTATPAVRAARRAVRPVPRRARRGGADPAR